MANAAIILPLHTTSKNPIVQLILHSKQELVENCYFLDCFSNGARNGLILVNLQVSQKFLSLESELSIKWLKNIFERSQKILDICREIQCPCLCIIPHAKQSLCSLCALRGEDNSRLIHCHLLCSFHAEQTAGLSSLITDQVHTKAV